MKPTRAAIVVSLCLLLIVFTAHAQTPNTKHFDKDGLSFDYPSEWALDDKSNSDLQQLTLTRADSDAQIGIFVHRGKVDTPEKMAKAKAAFIDPYIKATSDNFVQMGATKPEQTAASTEIGGAKAEGERLRTSLGGESAEATIYWLTLGNHVVLLNFFSPNTSIKIATPAWDIVRNSIHVEEAKPAPKPTPK